MNVDDSVILQTIEQLAREAGGADRTPTRTEMRAETRRASTPMPADLLPRLANFLETACRGREDKYVFWSGPRPEEDFRAGDIRTLSAWLAKVTDELGAQ